MKVLLKSTIAVSLMVIATFSNAAKEEVIPDNIQWPVPNKTIGDASLFYGVEDSVDLTNTSERLRLCRKTSYGSNMHFIKHLGLDFHVKNNTPVISTYPGVVRKIVPGGIWGKGIVISHPSDSSSIDLDNFNPMYDINKSNDWTSVYWHLQNINVNVGDVVGWDTKIGEIYSTTGVNDVSHLHFGLRPMKYNSKISHKGYGGCSSDTSNFVDPIKYFHGESAFVLDDTDATHSGSWFKSNATHFYHKSGYELLNLGEYGEATYNAKIAIDGTYSIYTRYTIDPNRTSKAKYTLFVNGVTKKIRYIDQRNENAKAKNHYLFQFRLKTNDKVEIVITNSDTTGYLVSDAIVFRLR